MPSQLNLQRSPRTPLPQVTEADLVSFHEAHFGNAAISHFATDFLGLKQANNQNTQADETEGDGEYYYYDDGEVEEDDGLGYYPDGVKRTLTDEQIAMFRHSEYQALERAREREISRRRNSSSPILAENEDGQSEDVEAIGEEIHRSFAGTKKKKNKNKKKRGSGNSNKQRTEPVIDLRKRTWDVVEQGVDSLDYDEMENAGTPTEHVTRRRKITYDDDG